MVSFRRRDCRVIVLSSLSETFNALLTLAIKAVDISGCLKWGLERDKDTLTRAITLSLNKQK